MNFVESKTSEAIADATDLMIESIPGWSSTIRSVMVTDSASNMKKAMRCSKTVTNIKAIFKVIKVLH